MQCGIEIGKGGVGVMSGLTFLHRVVITPAHVSVDGRDIRVTTAENGMDMLSSVYRTLVGDYPKFFKMDPLSRLGFLASELLLGCESPRLRDVDSRAVVLFNSCSSLADDTAYQATLGHDGTYYPSPALFVYTLPNIVTGEIAIRNKYYGETAFYLLPHKNFAMIETIVETSFRDPAITSAIAGWIEYPPDGNFEADLRIYTKL